MSIVLEAIQALAANETQRTVTLSAESVAVFLYASAFLERKSAWLDRQQSPTDEITDGEWDEIERMRDNLVYEVMNEVEIVEQVFPTFFEASPLHLEQTAGTVSETAVNTTSPYGVGRASASPGNGDEYQVRCLLDAGTYTLVVWYLRSTDCGMFDIYFDSVKQGDTVDGYGATLNTNAGRAITISEPGFHIIKVKVNGKNSSSTNYRLRLGGVWVYQTLAGGGGGGG